MKGTTPVRLRSGMPVQLVRAWSGSSRGTVARTLAGDRVVVRFTDGDRLHKHRVLPTPIPAKGHQGFWDDDRLPTAINVALGEELLPTTLTGRQAYYRGLQTPRVIEDTSRW